MREMKDSELEWIGKIPASWNVMPNKYLMKKKKVICPKYNGEDILSLTMKGVVVRDLDAGGKMPTSFDGYQRLEPGNLLMCLFDIDVTPRCIGLIKQAGLSSPAYSQFVLNDIGNAEYYGYYYTMIDNDKTLLHLAKNLRHSLTEDQLGAIATIVPPIQEQKQIANFLDAKCAEIDSLVADIQTQIDTLEQYKRSVISEVVTKGLNPAVEMKDSGVELIGDVPANWSVLKTIYVLAMPITDGPHITPELFDSGIPFISAEAVSSGKIDFNNMRGYISEDFYRSCCLKYTPKRNDIYMVKSGATTGRVAMVETDDIFTIWSPLAVFRANENKVLPRFLFYAVQSSSYTRQVESGWSFGTQQNIGMRVLEHLKICLPPLEEQTSIVKYIDAKCAEIDNIITAKKEQLETIEQYKKSIIYEYVTGKKEVPTDVS